MVILRFSLLPIYLQSYLNIAYDKVEDLKKEAGRITNIELQKKVSSIFYYLCVVTLQFAAPLIICLYLTLMYKSLGGLSWTALFRDPVLEGQCSADNHIFDTVNNGTEGSGDFASVTPTEDPTPVDFSILQSAQGLHESLTSLKNVSVKFTSKTTNLYMFFADFHYGRLQRLSRIRNLVELFCAIRHIVLGHCLPILFHKSLD